MATQMNDRELLELTQSIWSSVLGLEAQHGDVPSEALRMAHSMAGCVQISGPCELAVVVHVSAELARQAAAAMLCVPPEEASRDEIQDALGEITNMIGGSIKNIVAQNGALGLPAVAEGMQFAMRLPGSRVVTQIALACQGEPMTLSILERESR